MKKLLIVFAFFTTTINAQNVGIATTTPSEKLDVNGNINVSGTIKVNGVDGTAGQVLMKNSGGVFSWGNMGQYTRTIGFRPTSILNNTVYSWTVPATITKIFVECWGGGGGGASGGGGGGGGYVASEWGVAPGTVLNITVGAAGSGATSSSTNAVSGNNSVVQIGIVQLIAYGDQGGFTVLPGLAGGFTANTSALFAYGQSGSAGESNTETYGSYSATVFYTAVQFGSGGVGGNTTSTT
jgi:hypothetical protein